MPSICLLLLISAYAAARYDPEDEKEPICLIFAIGTSRLRSEEVEKFIEENPEISSKALSIKLVEDSYNLCVSKITDQEAQQIELKRVKNYMAYAHLIYIPLERYKTADLTISEKFIEKRKSLAKRVSKLNKLAKQDL